MQSTNTRAYDKNSKATAPALAPYLRPVGNITAININGEETIYDRSYIYDKLDRLTSDGVGEDDPMTYGYDLNDNRQTRKQGAGTDSIDELIDYIEGSNRIEERYTLKRGTEQVVIIPARTMTYNDVGRLYQLTEGVVLKAEYIYNDLGQRTKKTLYQSDGITVDSTTIYHYDQWGGLITETDLQGNLIKDYIWSDQMMPVAQIDAVIPAQAGIQSIETITYLYTDHLMTNRLATGQSKTIIWRWEGEAFGNTPAQELSGVSINLRFPGQYYDSETNLHYNWHRYYDPTIGRYITSDPIGLTAGMNTYLYANANPIIFYDPYGLFGLGENGVVAVTFNAANPKGFGVSAQVIVSKTGVSGYVGVGVGVGFGVSVTGGVKSSGSVSGVTARVSASGSINSGGKPGANVYGGVSEGGSAAGTGIGVGIGAGVTATVGYAGTIINWGNPGPVDDDVQKEYCKQNPGVSNCKEDEANQCE